MPNRTPFTWPRCNIAFNWLPVTQIQPLVSISHCFPLFSVCFSRICIPDMKHIRKFFAKQISWGIKDDSLHVSPADFTWQRICSLINHSLECFQKFTESLRWHQNLSWRLIYPTDTTKKNPRCSWFTFYFLQFLLFYFHILFINSRN